MIARLGQIAGHTHTPAPQDDTANYAIYLKDFRDFGQAKAVRDLLGGMVADETSIFVSATDFMTCFLAAPLSAADAEIVKGDSNVRRYLCRWSGRGADG